MGNIFQPFVPHTGTGKLITGTVAALSHSRHLCSRRPQEPMLHCATELIPKSVFVPLNPTVFNYRYIIIRNSRPAAEAAVLYTRNSIDYVLHCSMTIIHSPTAHT